MTVAFDGRNVDVDPAKVGANATLLDVWKQAFPTEDPAKLEFDIVGSDGFRPTSRSSCTRLLTGAELASGKVEAGSHDVAWDDSVKLAKCYRVKSLSRLEAKR